MDFPINYLKPCHAGWRAAVGPGHTAGIEKQNATAPFVSRDVRVAVQDNIDVVWRSIRWNVLKPKFQSAAHQIDNQRPVEIAVTVSAHQRDARPDRP